MAWKPFGGVFSKSEHTEDVTNLDKLDTRPVREAMKSADTRGLSFDALGQRDEALKHKISTMVDRLDDIRSLNDEFRDIIHPLSEIVEELPRARKRNAELEAMLTQERSALFNARNEASEAMRQAGAVNGELSELLAKADSMASELDGANQLVEKLRSEVGDRLSIAEDLERKLFVEVEQRDALTAESRGLRTELQATESSLSAKQRDLQEARAQIEVLEQDNRRLQNSSEEQTVKLDEQMERLADLEGLLGRAESEIESVRILLAGEAAERQRVTSQLDAEGAAHRNERASLTVKLDAANGRSASVEKVLAQARAALRERDEVEQSLKRQLKDALAARAMSDKRLEAIQEDLSRQIGKASQAERQRTELASRVDMLTKAIAAKDALIDQAAIRAAILQEHIDESGAKYASARSELELANRRLTEELENERSERAMAQGALGIARDSRAALQKQYDVLKRTARTWRDPAGSDDEEEAVTNVTPFSKSMPKKNTNKGGE